MPESLDLKHPWQAYWQADEFWTDSALWKENARIFTEKLQAFVNLSPQDEVLDIGCGPGHALKFLAPRVGRIQALDPAPRFVERCRELNKNFDNVSAAVLEDTDFARFGKFSLFLCVSVVQYYRSPSEVVSLIRSAAQAAKPGARLLIADIPVREKRAFGSAGLLVRALRYGFLGALVSSALRLAFQPGRYRLFAKENPELSFTAGELQDLLRQSGFEGRVLTESFSIHPERLSLWVEFP